MIVRRREFSYEFDESVVPRELAEEFAAGFEAMELRAGQTVQVGWTVLSVVAGPQGLELHEPDMAGEAPLTFVPGLTRTLRDTLVQRYVLDSLGLTEQMDFANLAQSVIVCDRLEPGGGLYFTRPHPAEDDASGWLCICCDQTHDHGHPDSLRLGSLYALACRHPSLIEFMAMPVGSTVILMPGLNPGFYHGDRELTVRPGSYLAEKA